MLLRRTGLGHSNGLASSAPGSMCGSQAMNPIWRSSTREYRGGGSLEIAGSGSLGWAPTNFWSTRWTFSGPRGNRLVSFDPGTENSTLSGVFKTQARVQVDAGGYSSVELALLILPGWYLVIVRQEDIEAAIAATAAATQIAAGLSHEPTIRRAGRGRAASTVWCYRVRSSWFLGARSCDPTGVLASEASNEQIYPHSRPHG